ncbi:TetR/AcrR family transcriptional regulator [Reinekea blandensis]|uniref:HTH tetR-type domain-containing protein n=1 Tax=Reinekea blandensis MED297 TaxID=314283 RepID=A4BBU8_9GAMM|nr:TetR/AcrR family transcriptional regulator [Reinekea blandensis]EAR10433.1 hypothetical protein MED297_01390 [Reinekea sp. MED297] [Reinekea blandensis MED297]
MNKTQEKIATGLETAFAKHGYTEMGVDGLRNAAQVSLRTLYKYCPSKEDMILLALEHRHKRYEAFLRERSETEYTAADLFDRIGRWMQDNDSQGCLFHDAVLSHPGSKRIRAMYTWHKEEIARAMAKVTGLDGKSGQLLLIHEGIVQSWPLLGVEAVTNAKQLFSGV